MDSNAANNPKKVKFNLWHSFVGADQRAKFMDVILAQFKDKYPEIEIVEQEIPRDQYQTKLKTQAAAGQLPEAFLIWPNAMTREFANANLISDINDLLKANPDWKNGFIPRALDEFTVNGKTYSAGLGVSVTSIVFYNKALFDKYGFDPNSDLSFVKQAFTMDQFLSGELDAASAMTYNEYHVVLESGVSESDLNVIDMNDEGVAMLEDNLFANKEWLEENKETAAKFLRASIKGWQEAIKDPEGAVDIIMAESEEGSSTREHQLTMMKEVAKLVVPEGFDPEKIGQTDAEMFQQTADIAHQFGVIEKPANVEEAFTNEIFEMATSQ